MPATGRLLPGWLWKDTQHAKLVDGFTFRMPDRPANQRRYPQAERALLASLRIPGGV